MADLLEPDDLMVVVRGDSAKSNCELKSAVARDAVNFASESKPKASDTDNSESKFNICCDQINCPKEPATGYEDGGVTARFFRKGGSSSSCPCKRRGVSLLKNYQTGTRKSSRRSRAKACKSPYSQRQKSPRDQVKEKLKERDNDLLYKQYLQQLLKAVETLKAIKSMRSKNSSRVCKSQPVKEITNELSDPELDKFHVPPDMGWDWKAEESKRKGWYPGAIPDNIRKIMAHFQPPICPVHGRPRSSGGGRPGSGRSGCPDRVQIQASGYPVQVRLEQACLEEQMLAIIAQIKVTIRQKGYGRCVCRQSLDQCQCREQRDYCALMRFVGDCERAFGIDTLAERIYLDDLDELTLEFTPPAAICRSPPSTPKLKWCCPPAAPSCPGAKPCAGPFFCQAHSGCHTCCPPPKPCGPYKCVCAIQTQYDEADFKQDGKRVSTSAESNGDKGSEKGDKGKKGKGDKKEKGKKGDKKGKAGGKKKK